LGLNIKKVEKIKKKVRFSTFLGKIPQKKTLKPFEEKPLSLLKKNP